MDHQSKTVVVSILDKEFRLACKPEAENALKEAAAYLDKQMRQIRRQGRVIGLDRIAVMAGLSISNELLQQQKGPQLQDEGITDRLQVMQQKIDFALAQATLRKESQSVLEEA
ncbi:MAG: cell division protein ZapA [Gammaproteobacteria bacterium]